MEPSFQVTRCNFKGESYSGEELFRNTLVNKTKLIKTNELDGIEFYFETKPDPQTGEKIDLTFTKADFVELSGQAGESLIKRAAYKELESLSGADKVKMSIKHQVLCEDTAIIGVMKQPDNATGELKETQVKFTRED